jgi:hypothetical protein
VTVQAVRGFKSHRHRQPMATFPQVRSLREAAEMLFGLGHGGW